MGSRISSKAKDNHNGSNKRLISGEYDLGVYNGVSNSQQEEENDEEIEDVVKIEVEEQQKGETTSSEATSAAAGDPVIPPAGPTATNQVERPMPQQENWRVHMEELKRHQEQSRVHMEGLMEHQEQWRVHMDGLMEHQELWRVHMDGLMEHHEIQTPTPAPPGTTRTPPATQENEIDIYIMLIMPESDLKDIGITKFGERRRLFNVIQNLNCEITQGLTKEANFGTPVSPDLDESQIMRSSSDAKVHEADVKCGIPESGCPGLTSPNDYNLCDILENHVNRKTALENPESDVVLSDDNRRKLVDIIVVFIVEVWA